MPVFSQTSDSLRSQEVIEENKVLKQIQEDAGKDSSQVFYKRLKKKLSKTKFSKGIYRLLFREPYRQPTNRTTTSPSDPYRKYDGRTIGNIFVKKLDPFGPRVYDTLRLPANLTEKAANSIHRTTRKYVIKKTLLFKEGDPLNSLEISDNERILRQSPNLLDARIVVLPRTTNTDTVDVLVITQDIWSISGNISLGGFKSGRLQLNDNNFLGLGHELLGGFSYSSSKNPYTKAPKGWGYQSLYRIPFIGKTFITGQLEYVRHWDQDRYGIVLRRNFLTPTTRYAGSFEFSRNHLLTQIDPIDYRQNIPDSIQTFLPFAYNLVDGWLGRSFRFNFGSKHFQERTRLIIAARMTYYNYFERPLVRQDTNQYFHNRFLKLVSIGISSRSYLRDVLIYGFGRTEDIPYGGLLSFTGGTESSEFGKRFYAGAKASYGQYYKRLGYIVYTLNAGSFMNSKSWEQGVFRAEMHYFSRLFLVGTTQIRQFMDVRYIKGIDRFTQEFIDISGNNGIRGMGSPLFRGDKSIAVNLETVCFTPLNILGFQIAFFTYADLGMVAPSKKRLLSSSIYQGYGIGLRVRNENLTFNTFQLRLGYYPNLPNRENLFRGDLSGLPRVRLSDFEITAPETVPFR
jgi:hypothetical protein